MSKRYYYRRTKRTYPKQKWQMTVANVNVIFPNAAFNASTFNAKHSTICQTVVPTDQSGASVVSANNIVKTGNFKVKGTFNGSLSNIGGSISAIIYVIFVPQGIIPDNNNVGLSSLATSLFYSHPEWVLGWTRINMNEMGSDNFSITSRLKRNLNSGDSVQLGVLLMNQDSSNLTVAFNFRATVSYCARAN